MHAPHVGGPAVHDPSVRRAQRALVLLVALAGVLQAVRVLTAPVAGPPGGVTASAPLLTPMSALVADPGARAFVTVAVVALHAAVAVGVARWRDGARLFGAGVADIEIGLALLGTISLFVFPPAGWAGAVVLAAAHVAVDAAWLVCAFHPPLARAFRARTRGSSPRA